jgi:cell division protein FtsQ
MISFKSFKKKLQSSGLFSWRRKSPNAFRNSAFTKQPYTAFHAKASQSPSKFRSGLKKIFSVFSRLPKPAITARPSRKTNSRIFLLTVCLVVAGVAGLMYAGRGLLAGYITKMEYFEVQDNVLIEGCRITLPAEIRELAEIRYHTNLFSISSGKLEAILVRHPWVSEVKIRRTWPNRLLIHIVEHVPEAIIVQGNTGKEQLYYMNAKGIPFVPVKPGQDLDYPVITGAGNFQAPEKRKEILSDAAHFLKLLKANNPNLPSQSVSEIHLDTTEGMVIYLVEYPFPIFFGSGGVGKKYKQLQDVLGVLYKQRKEGSLISQVEYIRMDYLTNKVLVAQSGSG